MMKRSMTTRELFGRIQTILKAKNRSLDVLATDYQQNLQKSSLGN